MCSFADDVPPYFKTEPARSQLNLERNKVVLTCMAEGSWPLEFKWIHNNTELTRFSLEYRSEVGGVSAWAGLGRVLGNPSQQAPEANYG